MEISQHISNFTPFKFFNARLWMLALAPLIFSHCGQNNLILQPQNSANGPVIQCIIGVDSNHTMTYSRVSELAEDFQPQTQANIKLIINRKTSDDWRISQTGHFECNSFPAFPRDSLRLNLTSPHDTLSVDCVMPSAIKFTKTDTATLDVAGIGRTQNFKVQFRDSAIDENYYRLTAQRKVIRYKLDAMGRLIDSTITLEPLKIDGNETAFLRNNFNNYTDHEILFSDEIFNGVLTTFNFHNLIPIVNTRTEKTPMITITLENLSFSLYEYYNSRAAHLWNQKSITQLPGAVESNIPKGYGVFGAATKTTWIVNYK